jgi:hypothetical protein
MNNRFIQIAAIALILLVTATGCKKEENAPLGTVSPYISIFDVRDLYKGEALTLSKDNLGGSTQIAGLVVSDHSGKNLPQGLLVVQDGRRLGQLRGISIALGADAAFYVPGDSVVIDVEGGVLQRVNGILQIANVTNSRISKVTTGRPVPLNKITIAQLLAAPDKYESVLSVVVKGGFNPLPAPTDVFAGDKVLNDGFGNATLHTETTAIFAQSTLPVLANYYCISFNKPLPASAAKEALPEPQLRMRTAADMVVLSSQLEVPPAVISGFMSDLEGGDGNYEYIQFLATRNIDFSVTPMSVVVTNNANASTPTGVPAAGWATGNMRTYKINLTSGTALKGTFFYVGGTGKTINGPSSTNIAAANWVKAYDYVNNNGEGFGNKTSGLLANSGNASGIALFAGTSVTAASVPVDVLFIGTGGSLYSAGPPAAGYRISNNDWYDMRNPITLTDQPFYRAGTNTLALAYTLPADAGLYNIMGGVYNTSLARWTTARAQKNIDLSKTSVLADIEGAGSTRLE